MILDIVPNHTSDQHAWFQAALAAGPGSPERARYVFRPGQGARRRAAAQRLAEHVRRPRLDPGRPTASGTCTCSPRASRTSTGRTPRSAREFESVLAFWFDRGVDGFRIDVAHGLIKQEGLPDLGESGDELEPTKREDHPHWDRDGVHEIFREWRKVADRYAGDRVFVAEAWVSGPRAARPLRTPRTSCTPPSTSTTCAPRGTPRSCAR